MNTYDRQCAYECTFTFFAVFFGISTIVAAINHGPIMVISLQAALSAVFAAFAKFKSQRIALILKLAGSNDSNDSKSESVN